MAAPAKPAGKHTSANSAKGSSARPANTAPKKGSRKRPDVGGGSSKGSRRIARCVNAARREGFYIALAAAPELFSSAIMSNTLLNIPVTRIDGTPATLAEYAGKVLLVVNVASKCGLTPQYEGLESLYREYGERGLVVVGFPSNDFGEQEPGSEAEISNFCTSVYGVQFPMFSKIGVTGADKHPLYRSLIDAIPVTEFKKDSGTQAYQLKHFPELAASSEIKWNFEKFLIARDGNVLRRFGPDTEPRAPEVVSAIESALSA